MKRMLDLFCGRGGWTNAFLDRGWEVVGVDLVRHPEYRGEFIEADALEITPEFARGFDFGCASSPCEEFSVHGMKMFHKAPKFPDMGLVLFCWTRRMFDTAGIPYVMENVRAAQDFVGKAAHKCGPFHLWGNAVPPLMPQGITKGTDFGGSAVIKGLDRKGITEYRKQFDESILSHSKSKERKAWTAKIATVPPELAACVAAYADRITS